MPENHDHSKYVAVESHYEGHRRDINDLDLKAYIDERIANAGGSSSYLSYIALITQAGTSAPTAVVLNSADSNYLGDIVWSYVDVGAYDGTLAAAFTENKTFVIWSNMTGDNAVDVAGLWVNSSIIEIYSIDRSSELGTNSVLLSNPIEIRVYP